MEGQLKSKSSPFKYIISINSPDLSNRHEEEPEDAWGEVVEGVLGHVDQHVLRLHHSDIPQVGGERDPGDRQLDKSRIGKILEDRKLFKHWKKSILICTQK